MLPSPNFNRDAARWLARRCSRHALIEPGQCFSLCLNDPSALLGWTRQRSRPDVPAVVDGEDVARAHDEPALARREKTVER